MIGSSLAHYRITAELGSGGMGEVWRAEDTKLGREVALKVLPEEFARDPDRMARFEREAKVLASLNHPNIATLYGLESSVILSKAEGRVEGSPEGREKRVNRHSPTSGDPSTSASLRDASAQDDSGQGGANAPTCQQRSSELGSFLAHKMIPHEQDQHRQEPQNAQPG